jgi:hypothetical protein
MVRPVRLSCGAFGAICSSGLGLKPPIREAIASGERRLGSYRHATSETGTSRHCGDNNSVVFGANRTFNEPRFRTECMSTRLA